MHVQLAVSKWTMIQRCVLKLDVHGKSQKGSSSGVEPLHEHAANRAPSPGPCKARSAAHDRLGETFISAKGSLKKQKDDQGDHIAASVARTQGFQIPNSGLRCYFSLALSQLS